MDLQFDGLRFLHDGEFRSRIFGVVIGVGDFELMSIDLASRRNEHAVVFIILKICAMLLPCLELSLS